MRKREDKIRIFSADGGGVRSAIPNRILKSIEDAAKLEFIHMFDYGIGVSAGTLLIESLVMQESGRSKYTTKDLIKSGVSNATGLFPQDHWSWVKNCFGIFYSKYTRDSMDNTFGKVYGNSKLADTIIPITSYSVHLESNSVKTWSTFKARLSEDENLDLKDLAGAVSAAPTFLDPKVIAGQHYVDGGVYDNNPAIHGFAELKKYYPDITEDDVIIVSIGTGQTANTTNFYSDKNNYGLFQWIFGENNLLNIFSTSSRFGTNDEFSKIFPHSYRLQPILPNELMALDKPSNIPALIEEAGKYVAQNQDKIAAIVADLTAGVPGHRLDINYANSTLPDTYSNTLEPPIDNITIITETDSAYWSSYAYSAAKYSAAALLGMTAGVGLSAYVAMSSAEALAEIFMTVTDNSVFCH